MSIIKFSLMLFSIIFTTTTLTYSIFNEFLNSDISFFYATLQSAGLSFIFTFCMLCLDFLSNYIKILNTKFYVIIQYFILLFIITNYAKYFKWGDWNNSLYILIFIISFSFIYTFIYIVFDIRYKKEDEYLHKKLKSYQNKIR